MTFLSIFYWPKLSNMATNDLMRTSNCVSKKKRKCMAIDGQELSNLSKTDSLQIGHSQSNHGYHPWSIVKDTWPWKSFWGGELCYASTSSREFYPQGLCPVHWLHHGRSWDCCNRTGWACGIRLEPKLCHMTLRLVPTSDHIREKLVLKNFMGQSLVFPF